MSTATFSVWRGDANSGKFVDYTIETAKQSIASALQRQDIEEGDRPVALSFRWRMEPSYDRVKTLAEANAE